MNAFKRVLTGELVADMGPLRIVFNPDVGKEEVRARPRCLYREKMDMPEDEIQQVVAASMFRLNRRVTCSTAALAVLKARGYRQVVDFLAASVQVEQVPWLMPDLEETFLVSVQRGIATLIVEAIVGLLAHVVGQGGTGFVHHCFTFWIF